MARLSNSEAVRKVILFGYNYPQGFIYRVWEGDDNLIKHFESKFTDLYERYTSNGVFNAFYCNLSNDNQDKLTKWILANYKG